SAFFFCVFSSSGVLFFSPLTIALNSFKPSLFPVPFFYHRVFSRALLHRFFPFLFFQALPQGYCLFLNLCNILESKIIRNNNYTINYPLSYSCETIKVHKKCVLCRF